MLDSKKIKKDFPILSRKINGNNLVYLDSAATSQKPQVVIDAITNYYQSINANIHRGVHTLSEEATDAYEATRKKVAQFINAREVSEIIFTSGTTDSINLVAQTWGQQNIKSGDEIVISAFEHHSNLVPWQQLCLNTGAKLKVISADDNGGLDLSDLDSIFTKNTKLLAITHMSNATGAIMPLDKVIQVARSVGAKVLIDGAQSAPHIKVDVQKLDCDFFVFSAHKMLGPTGVGFLYGKSEILEGINPAKFGGDMVNNVTFEETSWNEIPWKFEAGTQNIAGVVGFLEALNYLEAIGMENVFEHSHDLAVYSFEKFSKLPGINLYGTSENNGGIMLFNIDGIHCHDVGSIVNSEGVAIRTGHHCAQPILNSYGSNAASRLSFYIYNSREDVDVAFSAMHKAINIFKPDIST